MCVCGVGLVFAPLVMITVKWLSSKINKGGSTDEQREMLSCHTPFRNYYQVRLDVAIEEWNISVWESAFDHNRSFWMSMNTFQYNCIHSVWVYFCPFNTTNKGIWNQHPLLISIDSPYLWQSPFVCKKKKDNRKKTRWIYRPHNRPHCSQLRYHGMPKNMLTIFQLQINGLAHE